MQAIEAATLCPSSGGKQTYKCYVITDSGKIAAIGQAVQSASDYLASLPQGSEVDREEVERWRAKAGFFAQAPVLLAVSTFQYQSLADKLQAMNMDNPRVAEINRGRRIAASRIQTVGAFVDHLLLALHTLGLGAVWMTGPTMAKKEIEKIIGMGPDEDFVALVPVGYPAEEPEPPARKPLSELVEFIRGQV